MDYTLAICGADPFGLISTKIGAVVGVDDVVIQSNFGFNIFKGFRSTGQYRVSEFQFSY